MATGDKDADRRPTAEIMYDIKWIRDNLETFADGLTRRNTPDDVRQELIDKILGLDDARRAAIAEFEQAQARRNAASKEIGAAKKAKDEARASALMAEVESSSPACPSWRPTPSGWKRN